MKTACIRITFVLTALCCSFSGLVFAGTLDDQYLAAYGARSGSALEKAVLLQAGETGGMPHCGTPLKHGLQRDWSKLEPATQKLLAKQVTQPVLSGEATLSSSGGNFRIHYATSGGDTPVPAAPYTLASWVQQVADSFETTYGFYQGLGYNPPPVLPYHVYLRDLASQTIYGQTISTSAAPSAGFPYAFDSYIEIDKDFTSSIYVNANGGPYTPLQSLQITSAHEFHHAIQYGYNFFFDIWYAEATSTWFEDEAYDSVNQLYNYIPAWFGNSTLSLDTATSIATGGGYSRWIFNRYLAEQHGTGVIRAAWEKLAPLNSPGGNADIPMVPVLEELLSTVPYNSSLGTDFFAFAKRVYVRDWTSHAADSSLIHPYSPVAIFNSFPISSSSTLAHYSFALFRFIPSATVPTLNMALSKTSGIRTALFKTVGNGTPVEITANSDGSYTVTGFGSLSPTSDEVVLLAANITDTDNHQVSFSTSGTAEPVSDPAIIVVDTGGGGGGCFIATAAYGSYLHPQVRLLREFRDRYLLTNVPGRAFVALYYRVSPPVADFIAHHEMLRLLVRLMLAPVIFVIAKLEMVALIAGTALLGWLLRKICLRAVMAPARF